MRATIQLAREKESLDMNAMRNFREWAVRMALHGNNPDWAMPVTIENETEFVFSVEAYNEFMCKCTGGKGLGHVKLAELLEKYKDVLYWKELPVKYGERFFLLPNTWADSK